MRGRIENGLNREREGNKEDLTLDLRRYFPNYHSR